MSTKRVESLKDCSRFGIAVIVKCGCGHEAALPTRPLLMKFHERRWSMDFASVRQHLRCSVCGGRPVKVGPDPR